MRAAVVGAGNFGTAIANIIAKNGHRTHLWMRDPNNWPTCADTARTGAI